MENEKKLEKPVLNIVEFDEKDIVTSSVCPGAYGDICAGIKVPKQ